MFHQEFNARLNGRTKKIGILGEVHAYTETESDFANRQVSNYTTIGVELPSSNSYLGCITTLPFILAGVAISTPFILAAHLLEKNLFPQAYPKRNPFIKNAREHAKDLNKRVVNLDGLINPLKTNARLIWGTFLAPYSAYKIYFGRKSTEEKYKKWEETLIEGGYPENLGWWIYWTADIKKRDKHMAQKATEFLRTESDEILINCGMTHALGIRRNLEQMTENLTLVKTERCG